MYKKIFLLLLVTSTIYGKNKTDSSTLHRNRKYNRHQIREIKANLNKQKKKKKQIVDKFLNCPKHGSIRRKTQISESGSTYTLIGNYSKHTYKQLLELIHEYKFPEILKLHLKDSSKYKLSAKESSSGLTIFIKELTRCQNITVETNENKSKIDEEISKQIQTALQKNESIILEDAKVRKKAIEAALKHLKIIPNAINEKFHKKILKISIFHSGPWKDELKISADHPKFKILFKQMIPVILKPKKIFKINIPVGFLNYDRIESVCAEFKEKLRYAGYQDYVIKYSKEYSCGNNTMIHNVAIEQGKKEYIKEVEVFSTADIMPWVNHAVSKMEIVQKLQNGMFCNSPKNIEKLQNTILDTLKQKGAQYVDLNIKTLPANNGVKLLIKLTRGECMDFNLVGSNNIEICNSEILREFSPWQYGDRVSHTMVCNAIDKTKKWDLFMFKDNNIILAERQLPLGGFFSFKGLTQISLAFHNLFGCNSTLSIDTDFSFLIKLVFGKIRNMFKSGDNTDSISVETKKKSVQIPYIYFNLNYNVDKNTIKKKFNIMCRTKDIFRTNNVINYDENIFPKIPYIRNIYSIMFDPLDREYNQEYNYLKINRLIKPVRNIAEEPHIIGGEDIEISPNMIVGGKYRAGGELSQKVPGLDLDLDFKYGAYAQIRSFYCNPNNRNLPHDILSSFDNGSIYLKEIDFVLGASAQIDGQYANHKIDLDIHPVISSDGPFLQALFDVKSAKSLSESPILKSINLHGRFGFSLSNSIFGNLYADNAIYFEQIGPFETFSGNNIGGKLLAVGKAEIEMRGLNTELFLVPIHIGMIFSVGFGTLLESGIQIQKLPSAISKARNWKKNMPNIGNNYSTPGIFIGLGPVFYASGMRVALQICFDLVDGFNNVKPFDISISKDGIVESMEDIL